jgi:chaperonin cofactor prefoldin
MEKIDNIGLKSKENSNGATITEVKKETGSKSMTNDKKSFVVDVYLDGNNIVVKTFDDKSKSITLPDVESIVDLKLKSVDSSKITAKDVRGIVKDITDNAYFDFGKMLSEKASKNDVEAIRRKVDGIPEPTAQIDYSNEIESLKNSIELLKKKIELRDSQIKELECKLNEADKCFEKFVVDNEKFISELSNDHERLSNLHNTLAVRCEEEFEVLENAIDKKPNEIVIREVVKDEEVKEKTCNEAFLELFNEKYSLADYFFYMTSQRSYPKSYYEMSLYIEECRDKIKEIYGD